MLGSVWTGPPGVVGRAHGLQRDSPLKSNPLVTKSIVGQKQEETWVGSLPICPHGSFFPFLRGIFTPLLDCLPHRCPAAVESSLLLCALLFFPFQAGLWTFLGCHRPCCCRWLNYCSELFDHSAVSFPGPQRLPVLTNGWRAKGALTL